MSLDAKALDGLDSVAALRAQFLLPEGVTYLDGNSLGALPRAVPDALDELVRRQWGEDLIASWNRHDWIGLPERVGERIAPLIGAAPGQVLCCDSISVNLFKLLAAALALRPERRKILTVQGDFPSDGYIAQGLARLLGEQRCEITAVQPIELSAALDDSVAVLLLTEVNYRTGERLPMDDLTQRAHAVGALSLWDLAHSAGALPVELDRCEVDMAVGCGYKYFNGGPGAPAFVYVNRSHHQAVEQPISGWLGHGRPFDFSAAYEAAPGILRFLAGTPPILGMVALDAALTVFDGISIQDLRRKSLALGDFFISHLQALAISSQLECVTPQEHARRGSQISLRHDEAWGISQALIERGVIVDFRAPDIVRFGFAPLYNSFADVERAAQELQGVLKEGRHLDPRFQRRPAVT